MADTGQSQKLKDINERIDEFVTLSDAEFKAWQQVYDRGWDYILNNQLAGKIIKEGWDKIQVNHIFYAVMQEMAVISQRKPKIETEPAEGSDVLVTQLWSGIARHMFDKTLNMPMTLMRCSLDGKANGHYAVKVYWEPKASWNKKKKKWDGEVRITVLRAESLIIDPKAESVEDAEFVGVQTRVSVEYAQSRWPDFKKEIEDEARLESDPADENPAAALYVTRTDAMVTLDGGTVTGERDPGVGVEMDSLIRTLTSGPTANVTEAYKEMKKAPVVTVTEIWVRDMSEEKVTEEVPADIDEMLADGRVIQMPSPTGMPVSDFVVAADGQPLTDANWPTNITEYMKPKFPYGRYYLRVGHETILNPNDEDQIWYTEHWPIITGVNYMLPHTWHGLNAVEIPSGLQDWLNIGYMHLVNCVKYHGDPITIVEEGAFANVKDDDSLAKKIRSKAGAIWKVMKGRKDDVRREPPPPIGNGIPMLIDGITEELKNMTGSQDIMRGQASGGRQTAYEVSQLATAAASRPQLQSNLLDEFTLRVMRYAVELAMATMSPGDMVRIVGDKNRQAVVELKAGDFDADFDMKLDVATAMPFNREQKRAEALQLFQVIGPAFLPRLLSAYEVPNPEEILAKIAEQQAQEQAMAQAQTAPPTEQGVA